MMRQIENSTDKHGFEKRRKPKFSLILRLLLTLFVCGYALHRCSLRACADEITLTPEQTFALLGNQISGVAHSRVSGQDILTQSSVHFARVLSSQLVGSENSGKNFYCYNSSNASGDPANFYPNFSTVLPGIKNRQYLVFFVSPTLPDNIPTGWPSWNASDSASWHDFSADFTLPIQSCTDLKFSILYSAQGTASGYYGNVNNSVISLNNSAGVVARHPIGASSSYPNRFGILLTPFYVNEWVPGFEPVPFTAASVPESNRLTVAAVPLDYHTDNYDSFSVSGFSASLNMVNGFYNNDNSPITVGNFAYELYTPILFIQCPTISDYVPATTPPVTTRPPATAYSAESKPPSETVDLSYLESGVAAIVEQEIEQNQNLEWIGNNMMGAVNNLALISWQLDKIYAKMWDNGEVPLNAGLNPPNYENLQNFAQSALATRGTNSPAESTFNMQSGFAAFFTLGTTFSRAPLFAPFLLVAGVGLAMGVLAFVLFRKV